MYKFSFVETVGGKAVVVTQELFHDIIKREKIRNICSRIASSQSIEERSTLKRQLPAFCWHAWFDNGKRKNYAAHASGLIMIDLDHLENPRAFWEEIKAPCIEKGALVAHITPSTQGLRIIFPIPEGMNIEQAQAHYAKTLKLSNVDTCTKDLARLSFCVPEEYFLHLDEAIFETSPATSPATSPQPSPKEREIENTPSISAPSVEKPVDSRYPQYYETGVFNALAHHGALGSAASLVRAEEREASQSDAGKGAVDYALIVEALSTLLGGVPAHGSRNNFIFTMACYLRYVCNDDPDWIAQVLPTYGEAHDKWRRTIESACNRSQNRMMPMIVKRAIENARTKALPLGGDGEVQSAPPAMPARLPKLIRHLVKNVPEVCRPAVANAVFPALAAHLNGVKFWLIDGTEKEATFMCVTMAKQSSGKSSINKPIEYIIADIVQRDELNRRREQEWKDATAQKGANKEKPKRPDDLCVQVLVSDMTNAAFVQRMKDAGGKYLYTNLEELDLLKQLQTNGTKDVGKIICLCFDNGKYGQERVGTQSVTARVDLRWNWNASSTIQKGINFFKGRMVDGTLSRVNFSTIIPDKSKPFVYGKYDEQYAEALKPFITNLNLATGYIECPQALALARKMSDKCAEEAALTDDEVYEDLADRAVTIAYLKAMVLYIAHDMTWSKEIAEFAQWSLDYDLWCKTHFFSEQVREEKSREKVKKSRGRQNLLELLPASFTINDALNVRRMQGLDDEGCRAMVNQWIYRGYIDLDRNLNIYIKTNKFATRK